MYTVLCEIISKNIEACVAEKYNAANLLQTQMYLSLFIFIKTMEIEFQEMKCSTSVIQRK